MAKRISRRLIPLLLAVLAMGCARGGSSSPSRSSHQDSTGHDSTLFQVVPGQRFGAVTDSVSHADLARLFGAANVHEVRVQCAEGSCDERGTVVKVPGCPDTLRVFWRDTVALRGPSTVEAALSFSQYGDSTLHGCWRTEEGLGVGTTLRELESFNGPFQLEPLGEWDYAGYVGPWLHGRLSGVLEPPSGPRIGLRVDFLSSHGLSDSEFEQLSKPGRDSLQSDEPLLRKLNPSVVEMTMTFVREL